MKAWLSLSFSTLVRAFSKRDRTSFSNCLPVRGLILFAAMQVAVVVATHAACVLPPAGLVSWWTGNGNAADAMGLNAGFPQAYTTYSTGEVGVAFSLNGSTDYI